MEGKEMKEAEMGNMEARSRSALILVAFEVELSYLVQFEKPQYMLCELYLWSFDTYVM